MIHSQLHLLLHDTSYVQIVNYDVLYIKLRKILENGETVNEFLQFAYAEYDMIQLYELRQQAKENASRRKVVMLGKLKENQIIECFGLHLLCTFHNSTKSEGCE